MANTTETASEIPHQNPTRKSGIANSLIAAIQSERVSPFL
jgi:hypothetical protein